MSNLDQFESVFRAAAKPAYTHKPVAIERVLGVSDGDRTDNEELVAALRTQLGPFCTGDAHWLGLDGTQYDDIPTLLGRCETAAPHLICTYRQLHGRAGQHTQTLGSYVDVLTQATPYPILLLPRSEGPTKTIADPSATTMAVTDHLTGANQLVHVAAHFTSSKGRLWLTHVEDQRAFDRVIEAIGKIPTIDTDHARDAIAKQLLREPHDYVRSCVEGLEAAGVEREVHELVRMGRRLTTYKELITEHRVDLLVMNTKDEDQMAMHGMTYPLAIELHDVPMLLL